MTFQNLMFIEITGRVIDLSGDSVKLWVQDSKSGEEADFWYNRKTINDYWALKE